MRRLSKSARGNAARAAGFDIGQSGKIADSILTHGMNFRLP
jgi:hypothetical protein